MKPEISTYKNYSVSDFVWDEQFVHSCKNNTEANLAFWQKVAEAYPQQEKNMEDARSFLLHTKIKDELPSATQLENIWYGVQKSNLEAHKPVGRLRKFGWLR